MNPFDNITEAPYQLRVQRIGEALFVDAHKLLEVLQKRAMLCLRKTNALSENHIADFNRGCFFEQQELYKAIKDHVDKQV